MTLLNNAVGVASPLALPAKGATEPGCLLRAARNLSPFHRGGGEDAGLAGSGLPS